MCTAVRRDDGKAWWNLGQLVADGIIRPEHVPADPELRERGVSELEVCFCCVDVEAVLDAAGVAFDVDDLGDVMIGAC